MCIPGNTGRGRATVAVFTDKVEVSLVKIWWNCVKGISVGYNLVGQYIVRGASHRDYVSKEIKRVNKASYRSVVVAIKVYFLYRVAGWS